MDADATPGLPAAPSSGDQAPASGGQAPSGGGKAERDSLDSQSGPSTQAGVCQAGVEVPGRKGVLGDATAARPSQPQKDAKESPQEPLPHEREGRASRHSQQSKK